MLRTALANYAHTSWSGWMKYLFSKGQLHVDGSLTIPSDYVQRWTRQMNTSYDDLPKKEKKSDLEEADKMIGIFDIEVVKDEGKIS